MPIPPTEGSAYMTEPVSNIARRPGSVTVVVVLTIISGILTLLGALFLLLLGGAASLASNVTGVAVLIFDTDIRHYHDHRVSGRPGAAVQPQGERILRQHSLS